MEDDNELEGGGEHLHTSVMTEDSDELTSEEETEDLPMPANGDELRTQEDLLLELDELEREWIGVDYTVFDTCLQKFGLDRESFKKLHPNSVMGILYRKSIAIDKLYGEFVSTGLVSGVVAKNELDLKIRGTLGRISSICANTFQILENQVKLCQLSNGIPLAEEFRLIRFSYLGKEIKNPNQRYLQFLIRYASNHNYRKCNGNVMKPIYTEDRIATQTWEFLESIDTFVYNTANNHEFGQYFVLLTANNGCGDYCSKHLKMGTNIPEFPELKPDRLVFSFTNGIYFGKNDIFKKYSELTFTDREFVACKYFPIAFPEDVPDWRSINTPLFERILRYQHLEDAVIDWIYAFCGRMLYSIGDRDNWQVALYIFGASNSGKSTIAQILEMLFDEIHVGVLTCGNFEKNFGLESLCDKLMYTCPEVKKDFGMPQDILQTIICGENVQVPTKYNKAQPVKWKSHGMFFGNHFGNWDESKGAISRRFVVCEFPETVKEPMDLANQIQSTEIALLLKKMNCAYIDFTNKFGRTNIWSVLPAYFSTTSMKLKAAVNSLIKYIFESEEIERTNNADDLVPVPSSLQNFLSQNSCYRSECLFERNKGTGLYKTGARNCQRKSYVSWSPLPAVHIQFRGEERYFNRTLSRQTTAVNFKSTVKFISAEIKQSRKQVESNNYNPTIQMVITVKQVNNTYVAQLFDIPKSLDGTENKYTTC